MVHRVWNYQEKRRHVPDDWDFPKGGMLLANRLCHLQDELTGQFAVKCQVLKNPCFIPYIQTTQV